MRRGVTYGVIAGALWGTVFLAPLLGPDFSSLQMTAGRFTAYGLVSLLIALPSARSLLARVRRDDWVTLLKLALTGNFFYYFLISTAVHAVGVAPTSLIIGTLPVTITMLSAGHHGSVPLRRLVAPLALILIGIGCINLDVFTASGGSGDWIGSVLGIAAALMALASWSWFAVANTRALASTPRLSGNEWSLLWGIVSGAIGALLWLGAACLPTDWAAAVGMKPMTTERWHFFWMLNLGLAIGASWLANALWNLACRRLPMSLSGQMIVFETLFALLYGFLYAGRMPRPLETLAIALLIAGVLWSVRIHANDRPGVPV